MTRTANTTATSSIEKLMRSDSHPIRAAAGVAGAVAVAVERDKVRVRVRGKAMARVSLLRRRDNLHRRVSLRHPRVSPRHRRGNLQLGDNLRRRVSLRSSRRRINMPAPPAKAMMKDKLQKHRPHRGK
jgi:hypothetical protein